MKTISLTLKVLTEVFLVCRLPPGEKIPTWAIQGEFFSITKTADELSIVCPQESIPNGIKCEKDWRCIQVKGPLDFELAGILASLAIPLAESGISIFAVSTFDTDYLLVKQKNFEKAISTLRGAGHSFQES